MTPKAEDNSSPAAPPFVHGDTVHDCPPTLDDQGVIDFCRNGFLIYPGVVSDEINSKAVDYLDSVESGTVTELGNVDWFVDGVLKNPQAAGAVRALLGRDFTLPARITNHRGDLPESNKGGWHRDGGSIHTHRVEYLQVFYYPEACTDDMGPTEVLPGSHFLRTKHNMMSHFGKIAGTVSTSCVAGTIFLTVYSIWHRRSRATSGPTGKSKFRNLLKYAYWRTTAPQRDWIIDPPFDFAGIDFSPTRDRALFEQSQGAIAAGKMFAWLSGVQEQYVKRGGTCWPLGPVGMPPSLGNPTDKS